MSKTNQFPLDTIVKQLKNLARRATSDVIAIGGLLLAAQDQLKDGESFGRWLEKHDFGWSRRTCERYMRAHTWFESLGSDDLRQAVANNLTPSALYLVSSDWIEPAARQAILEAAKIRRITESRALEIINELENQVDDQSDVAGSEETTEVHPIVEVGDTRPLEVTVLDPEILPPAGPEEAEESEEPEEPVSLLQQPIQEIIGLGVETSLSGLDAGEVAQAIAILDQIYNRLVGAAARDRVKAIADRAEARAKKVTEPDYLSIPGFLKRPATEQSEQGAP